MKKCIFRFLAAALLLGQIRFVTVSSHGEAAAIAEEVDSAALSTLEAEPPPEGLIVLPHSSDPSAAVLKWRPKTGVREYVILRSETLGWMGSQPLLESGIQGSDTIRIASTQGLHAGEDLYFRQSDLYTIEEVLDEHTLKLVYPLTRNYDASQSYYGTAAFSGGWVKDYLGYTELARISDSGQSVYEWTDQNLSQEKDYFYTIGYSDGSRVFEYALPVNIKLAQSAMLYDAALGSSGGYAWKVTQHYGDTPALIDGNPKTYETRIQYNNPTIECPNGEWRGFHRFHLNDRMPIKRIEISQDASSGRIRAAEIRIGFDDRTLLTFNLQNDPSITRTADGNYEIFVIPVDRISAYVNVYIEGIIPNPSALYTSWNKVGIYTDQPIDRPITSPVLLDSTDIIVDFSQPDGKLPTIFGTDEIYDNTEGIESGWMLNSWPYTKEIFNLYRIQAGDYWPRHYGTDLIKIGELARDISASEASFPIQNVQNLNILQSGMKLKIDDELSSFSSIDASHTLTVRLRGDELTPAVSHRGGTPIYAYKSVGQLMRLQEILPEFKVEKIPDAYVSGISSISSDLDVNDPSRTAILDGIRMRAGDFHEGEVIRIGREIFKVLAVNGSPGDQTLRLQRGFDGSNQRYIQHNVVVSDVYKLLDYEPYYLGFKNDPTDYDSYFWDNFKTSMDKAIIVGGAIPWIIAYSPFYATEARGRVKTLETTNNPRGTQNNVILDAYNSEHDDADWWYLVNEGNDINNDLQIHGNMYQYYHAELHILTGDAAGKVFYVRSNTGERLRVVRTWDDSAWTTEDPEYIDLAAEGVKPEDVFKVTHGSNRLTPTVSKRFWQYNADLFYNMARYIRENYAAQLANKPFYMEFYLEPNLGVYGTWTLDTYIDAYNVFANTIRNGGPHFSGGFSKSEVVIGGGAIAGGLNPGVPIPGTDGDYDFALSLIDRASPIDFISHHRYYMGMRVQKRENSWEYWMLRNYALAKGKDIVIIDSEDSVATAGGTGNEEARHWAQFSVPYWLSSFINSYYGDHGELGRLDFIIHFRLYYRTDQGMGMAASDENGNPILDLVYWPIKMYLDHTSQTTPDTLVRVVKGQDQFGWIQAMGTIHGESGEKNVHLVNKKEAPVVVDLTLLGVGQISEAYMDSVIGGGPKQTITDGYHPPDLQGAIIRESIGDLHHIMLEPFSANIITVRDSGMPVQTFGDVPPSHPYYQYIEALYHAGYVAGCSSTPLLYCPERQLSREEMSVFIDRGNHSADVSPAIPEAQTFTDVLLSRWSVEWIELLWQDGFTAGCGANPLVFCPARAHTHAESCVFFLRMMYGADYVPPAAKGIFADVDYANAWYGDWVDAAWEVGFVEPCATTPELHLCPDDPLSRGEAAYMMYHAKGMKP
jgi:hypothetical protein